MTQNANSNHPVMPVKKLTGALVNSSLLVANPSQTGMDLGNNSLTMPGMFLNIAVDDIDFFDKNPRRQHDKELYGQIKESIRASGVQHPVHITRRPNESRYILAQGGNTRLKIVKELYQETGDARFASIPCIYTEYTNDEDIQIAHLIENEQRADMVFWDKACAYADVRDMLQAKSAEKLGLRKLVDAFAEHGLSVSFSKLSLFFFAAENLCALGKYCNSLSLSKTESIRKQYNDLLEQLPEVADAETEFALFWEMALEEWCGTYTEEAELDVPALQAFLQQQFETVYGIETEPASGANVPPSGEPATDGKAAATPDSRTRPNEGNPADAGVRSDSAPRTAVNPQPVAIPSGTVGKKDSEPVNSPALSVSSTPSVPNYGTELTDGKQAFQQLHEIVINLTNAVNIRDFLVFDDKMPYGYMMELPDFSKSEWLGQSLIDGNLNRRHPRAAVVYGYLWQTCGEEELFQSPDMLQKYNPFLHNERKCPMLAAAYRDPELFGQINELAFGGTNYFLNLNLNIYYLMTASEDLGPLLFAYLQAIININRLNASNWSAFKPC